MAQQPPGQPPYGQPPQPPYGQPPQPPYGPPGSYPSGYGPPGYPPPGHPLPGYQQGPAPARSSGLNLYDNWVVILSLFVCFPLGLVLLYQSPKFAKNERILVGGVGGVFMVLGTLLIIFAPQRTEQTYKGDESQTSLMPSTLSTATTTFNECKARGLNAIRKLDPRTGQDEIVCVPEDALDATEQAAGVRRSFPARYTIRKHDLQYIGVTRRASLRISVPLGLSREDLEANVRHALLTAYEREPGLGAVTVLAYKNDNVDDSFSAAHGVFAPGGRWDRPSSESAISSWSASIEFEAGYFKAPPKAIGAGTTVKLVDASGMIAITSNPTRWNDNEAIARVPSGTAARILSSHIMEFSGGQSIVRYEVQVLSGAKPRGWVHDYVMRP